jgi:pantetheine-phosphate adenylyltransferase
MITAVYPGTFDPLTRGHEDIVRRACGLFGKVIVAVADSVAKKPIFTLDERMTIAGEVLGGLGNVEIRRYHGLTVDFVRECGAKAVVRGVRSVTDFDYEFGLAGMNRHLDPQMETVFLVPSEGTQFITGTLIREIARMGGDVSPFVAPSVHRQLMQKLAAPG